MLTLSFRLLVVGGSHIRDNNALLIASVLTPTKELEPASKEQAGLVDRGVHDLASRSFKVDKVIFFYVLDRLFKWDILFPSPGAAYRPCL